jgi:hypothetical protein
MTSWISASFLTEVLWKSLRREAFKWHGNRVQQLAHVIIDKHFWFGDWGKVLLFITRPLERKARDLTATDISLSAASKFTSTLYNTIYIQRLLYIQGVSKKSFTTLKACINLFRGHVQFFWTVDVAKHCGFTWDSFCNAIIKLFLKHPAEIKG